MRHGARGGRKRAAHGDGRHREHDHAQHQTLERRGGKAEPHRAAAREIDRSREQNQKRAQRREHGDDALERRVEEERTRMAIGPRTEREPADAEAADEDRQHGGRRGGARAEDQPELTKPRRLIDESAEARPEQQRRHGCGARSHLTASASRRASARRRRRPPAARAPRAPAGRAARPPSAPPRAAGSASTAPRSPPRGRAIRRGAARRR